MPPIPTMIGKKGARALMMIEACNDLSCQQKRKDTTKNQVLIEKITKEKGETDFN